jgi:geranylgeranyl diphosphate synthase, type I
VNEPTSTTPAAELGRPGRLRPGDEAAGDLVVLLDQWGFSAGAQRRDTVHHAATPLHLAFSCYVFDEQSRLLVTRRAHHKATFPGLWTNSVCGHPRPGESLAGAVRRRASDELGLTLHDLRVILPEFRYRAEMDGVFENELCPVLVGFTTDDPNPDPSEVAEFRWTSWPAFRDEVMAGQNHVSPWCRQQVAILRTLGHPRTWEEADPRKLPSVLSLSRDDAVRRMKPPAERLVRRVDESSVSGAIDSLRGQVDLRLEEFLHHEIPPIVEIDPELSSLTLCAADAVTGGKRLRAMYAYWGWRGSGGEPSDAALSAAASLELLHAFALVHDDVMDDSDTRRWRPSTHRRLASVHRTSGWAGSSDGFGAAAAILVGDLCLSWADRLLLDCGLPAPALARAKPVYDAMRAEVVAGQYLDLVNQARRDTCLDRAMLVAQYKTASYTVERPLHLGAALAGAPEDLVGDLRTYGRAAGQAFQLRDDLLGVFGDPSRTGKPAGDDIRDGKRTPLMAVAMQRAGASARALLDQRLGDRDLDPRGLDDVRCVLAETGAVEEIERHIDALAEEARSVLVGSSIADPARTILLGMVELTAQRDA